MESYYRVGQAAEILGVTAHHVRTLCQRGLIPGIHATSSGHYRIPGSAIDRMTREGVPPIPAGTDHEPAASGNSSSPTRSSERSGLFADASEKVIEAQEDLVIAERRVKKRNLELQLEEIEDRFRERDAQAEQIRLEQETAEEARRSAAEHTDWIDQWTRAGLEQLPWDYPSEKRAEVIERLRSRLESGNTRQSDVLTSQLVQSIVASFTRPWRRTQEIERIAENATPFELRFDSELKQAARESVSQSIKRLGSESSDRSIEESVEQACRPLILQRQHREICNRLVEGTWSELRGATPREIEQAKDTVVEAFSKATAGTSARKLEQLRDEALESFKKVIRRRQAKDMRQRLLSNTFAICYGLAKSEVDEAVREVLEEFDQMADSTPETELRRARDEVFDRYMKKHRLIDKAAGGPLRDFLRKLEKDWEFDESTWTLQSELSEAVRRELTQEIDGTESQEQVDKLMRQIVLEELDIE